MKKTYRCGRCDWCRICHFADGEDLGCTNPYKQLKLEPDCPR